MSYAVGEVARLAGVTVRTLHHYDETGLLSPSGRSAANYRRYSEADIERLQQILFYRELGFPLEEIATILDDPDTDAVAHLCRQRRLLIQRIKRLESMVAAVDLALEARQMGMSLTPEERLEVFGGFDPSEYADEARDRWGDTEAYRESRRRTAGYTKQDWQQIVAASGDIERRFAEALRSGTAPDSTPAMDVAEEHRQHLSRYFYDCSPAMHRGLGDMYVADERFTEHYERVAAGLARYVRDAIHANADRAEAAANG
ncbi:MAG TPA: MerR family transcriptional regulator [Micromonosporaceae bacterium]